MLPSLLVQLSFGNAVWRQSLIFLALLLLLLLQSLSRQNHMWSSLTVASMYLAANCAFSPGNKFRQFPPRQRFMAPQLS
jgi:hypothetical protein